MVSQFSRLQQTEIEWLQHCKYPIVTYLVYISYKTPPNLFLILLQFKCAGDRQSKMEL